jgi:hypothetical protein
MEQKINWCISINKAIQVKNSITSGQPCFQQVPVDYLMYLQPFSNGQQNADVDACRHPKPTKTLPIDGSF